MNFINSFSKTTKTQKEDNVEHTPLNTLKIKLMSNIHPDGAVTMGVNDDGPTAFETDIFAGHALLVAKTEPICLNYSDCVGDNTFEIQVQGRFKKLPTGHVFVGADSNYVLHLGVMIRSIVQLVIAFLSTFVRNAHYSYGEAPEAPHYEKCHLVAPLWSTMGGVVVTPEGSDPPPMGRALPEDEEQKTKRKKHRHELELDLTSTYSFSMSSANMDIMSWQLIGVPFVHTISLRTFVGESPIQLVAYEAAAGAFEGEKQEKYPRKHSVEAIRYIFSLQLIPSSPSTGELPGDARDAIVTTAADHELEGNTNNDTQH